MKKIIRLSLCVSLLLFSHCATKQVSTISNLRTESPKAKQIEPEARQIFFQAEKYFFARDYERALPLYQTVKQRYPRGKAIQLASYRIGSIHYYQQEYPQASKEFELFINRYPQSELTFDVTYNWAAAEFQQENFERSQLILGKLKLADIQAQGPRRGEIVYQLAAQVATAMGNHTGAIAAYASVLQLPQTETNRSKAEEQIDKHLLAIQSKAELENLLNEVKEPSTRTKIATRIATANLSAKSGPATSPISDPFSDPSTASVDESPKSSTLIEGSTGERTIIGVVLPLTGKLAPYGKKALDAILLAARVFSPIRELEFRLKIEDTRSNPLVAAQAVDRLANEDHVMAIVGPLNWKESLFAAEKAQELGVINISLSSKEGISERGAYIFQNAMTPKLQLESLANHCVNTLNMKRFAILAPSNNFGKDMTSTFWTEVEKLGGRVVAFDAYPPDEKDFQSHVQELTGLNPKYRRFELSKMAEFIKEQKAKTGKEPKPKLKPIVDFEAIFIPDSPKTVAQIAANLAYYDVKGVSLLGTTEWNSEQLYRRGGRYVEGALFPGGISLSSQNPAQQSFVRGYVDAYGSNPDLLAGQAYEAMSLIATAIKMTSSSNRNEVVQFLAGINNFSSPLGSEISFDATRVAKRKVPIYRLESNGSIVQQ